jgi:hypothetical protein
VCAPPRSTPPNSGAIRDPSLFSADSDSASLSPFSFSAESAPEHWKTHEKVDENRGAISSDKSHGNAM